MADTNQGGSGSSKTTTDHEVIRKWAEERGGRPATVKDTGDGDEAGVLRIDFPGYSGEGRLEEISWEEFFEKFDEKKLAFLYQDETSSGKESRFFKLVSQDTAKEASRK
jgi:anaerobic selenocysteine-containing dehydrogenase